MRPWLLVIALCAVAACDGPRENAGEQSDVDNGAVNSEDTLRSGPAEALGEKQDRAAETAKKARDAEADSLEAAADERREKTDQQARELDQRAEELRSQ